MVKVKVGSPKDNSRQVLQVNHTSDAQTEFDIGGAEGNATLALHFNEVRLDDVNRSIEEFRILVNAMASEKNATKGQNAVVSSAQQVLKAAEASMKDRRWYSISAAGLLEAAKAVGEVASPLVSSALKVIDLISKASK